MSVNHHMDFRISRLTHDAANVYTKLARQTSINEPILPVRPHTLILPRDETHDDSCKGEEQCHYSGSHHLVADVILRPRNVRHLDCTK
jgi:hypothetical protein